MENMYSHRSEAYAVLSAFLFIAEYSKYFSLQFNNQCTLYCDNKVIVKKIKKFGTTTNYFKPYYKMSEHEAIIEIQYYSPSRINVIHLYSHLDKVKGRGPAGNGILTKWSCVILLISCIIFTLEYQYSSKKVPLSK